MEGEAVRVRGPRTSESFRPDVSLTIPSLDELPRLPASPSLASMIAASALASPTLSQHFSPGGLSSSLSRSTDETTLETSAECPAYVKAATTTEVIDVPIVQCHDRMTSTASPIYDEAALQVVSVDEAPLASSMPEPVFRTDRSLSAPAAAGVSSEGRVNSVNSEVLPVAMPIKHALVSPIRPYFVDPFTTQVLSMKDCDVSAVAISPMDTRGHTLLEASHAMTTSAVAVNAQFSAQTEDSLPRNLDDASTSPPEPPPKDLQVEGDALELNHLDMSEAERFKVETLAQEKPRPRHSTPAHIPASTESGENAPAFPRISHEQSDQRSYAASVVDDDPDYNPLYIVMSTSQSAHIRAAWQAAKLILVPSRSFLPLGLIARIDPAYVGEPGAPEDWERWVAMHAFCPQAIAPDHYINAVPDQQSVKAVLETRDGSTVINLQHDDHLTGCSPLAPSFTASVHSDNDGPTGPSETAAELDGSPPEPKLRKSRSYAKLIADSLRPPVSRILPRSSSLQIGDISLPHETQAVPSRQIHVIAEGMVYRRSRLNSTASLMGSLLSVAEEENVETQRKDKSKLRAPKWLKKVSARKDDKRLSTGSLLSTAVQQRSGLERVRVCCVTGPVVEWWGTPDEMQADSEPHWGQAISEDAPRSSTEPTSYGQSRRASSILSATSGFPFASDNLALQCVPVTRDVLIDLQFLLLPPAQIGSLESHFHEAIASIDRLVYSVIVDRSPSYRSTAQPPSALLIREQVIGKAWSTLCFALQQDLSGIGPAVLAVEGPRLLQIVENVTFAFLNSKAYTSSVLIQHRNDNSSAYRIMSAYRDQGLQPTDFGATAAANAVDLDKPVFTLRGLQRKESTFDPMSTAAFSSEALSMFKSLIAASRGNRLGAILAARTPLDCISIISRVVSETFAAYQTTHDGDMPETDQVIAMLCVVICRAGLRELVSLVFYARTYGITSDLDPQLEWALATFRTALSYVRLDPFASQAAREPAQHRITPADQLSQRDLSRSQVAHRSSATIADSIRLSLDDDDASLSRPSGSFSRHSSHDSSPFSEMPPPDRLPLRARSSYGVDGAARERLSDLTMAIRPRLQLDTRANKLQKRDRPHPMSASSQELLGQQARSVALNRWMTTNTLDSSASPPKHVARASFDSWRNMMSQGTSSDNSHSFRSTSPFPRRSDLGEGSQESNQQPSTWWDWGRARLNSVTSLNLVSNSPDTGELISGRSRTNSEAASLLTSLPALAEPQPSNLHVYADARTQRPRPRSLISLKSASSFETDQSNNTDKLCVPSNSSGRPLHARRATRTDSIRREVLAPRLDLSSAVSQIPKSSPTTNGDSRLRMYRSQSLWAPPSPICEVTSPVVSVSTQSANSAHHPPDISALSLGKS
ncbi:hypothetical protein E5Q_06710 [Mixia osmundae IAM 14324]|uniref:VPS9 domain-containing protein n=1 Tax=Mixia osmundae (strain CBS 9802 / IAM 14324 / JCM 22182 / KY 12970) TaxID=764103 RepID=G7EAZ7_MIXOS|nr:hypothetical protein E5Q_06710 [Mixia osmundae IAM 14324]